MPLLDLVGLDTSLAILDALYDEFRDPNYAPVPLLRRMVTAGQLGRKSGRGFYDYRPLSPPLRDAVGRLEPPPPSAGEFPSPLGPPAPDRTSSASAPTSSPARCWPPTGPACSRCPSAGAGIGWWSPDPRGVLPLDGLRCQPVAAPVVRRYEIRVDTAFDAVIDGLRRPRATGRLDHAGHRRRLRRAARARLGPQRRGLDRDGELVGGLYGVAIGGLFAGESMFHRARDASKVALVGLVERLRDDGATLLDVQWLTPHLASLGAVDVPRARYLDLLAEALPTSAAFA